MDSAQQPGRVRNNPPSHLVIPWVNCICFGLCIIPLGFFTGVFLHPLKASKTELGAFSIGTAFFLFNFLIYCLDPHHQPGNVARVGAVSTGQTSPQSALNTNAQAEEASRREPRLGETEMQLQLQRARPAVRREGGAQSAMGFYQNLHVGRFATLVLLPPATSFVSGSGDQDECPICLEEFKSGDLIQAFPCGHHVFHASCINSWIHGGRITCPVCRFSLHDYIMRQPRTIINLNP